MARILNKRLSIIRKKLKPEENADRCEKTERWVSALIIPFAVIGLLVYYSIHNSPDNLTIYPQIFSFEDIPAPKSAPNKLVAAHETHDNDTSSSAKMRVTVEGFVINKLKPVSESNVFATMICNDGHTYAVGSCVTDSNGKFKILGNLKPLNSSKPKDLVIYAKDGKGTKDLDGHITLPVEGQLQQRNVKIPPWALVLLPGIFFLSLWIAFVRAKRIKWKRLKHFTSVLLALLFTLSMIYAISSGINSS